MKTYRKVFTLLVSSIVCSLFIASIALAVGVSPVTNMFTAQPGQTVAGKLKIYSTEAYPSNYNVNLQDYYYSTEQNTKIFVDELLPRGLHQWLTLSETSAYLDPEEQHMFNYTITVPSDAAPGTYTTAFTAGGETTADGSGFGMLAKAVSYVELTIEGDYTESLELSTFEVDKQAFLQGAIVFNTTIENTGDISIAPTGTITIFDEKGEQVKDIAPVYQTFDGNQVEVSRNDELLFNPSLATTLPEEVHTYKTTWEDRKIESGKYTAKLKLFYGEDGTELEKETTMEIVENFYIAELSVEKYFSTSLPVSFSSTLQNTGTSPIEPTGYFEVKNLFGSQKKRVDFSKEELAMNSGEEKILDNLMWDNGFAMGYYTAAISVDVGGKVYTKTTSFMVVSWWQALILIALIVIILIVIIKGTKSYISLKKKLKKAESKEEKA